MIRIEINTDNAAFEGEGCGAEIARILKDAAGKMHGYHANELQEGDGWVLKDTNGNAVGRMVVVLPPQ